MFRNIFALTLFVGMALIVPLSEAAPAPVDDEMACIQSYPHSELCEGDVAAFACYYVACQTLARDPHAYSDAQVQTPGLSCVQVYPWSELCSGDAEGFLCYYAGCDDGVSGEGLAPGFACTMEMPPRNPFCPIDPIVGWALARAGVATGDAPAGVDPSQACTLEYPPKDPYCFVPSATVGERELDLGALLMEAVGSPYDHTPAALHQASLGTPEVDVEPVYCIQPYPYSVVCGAVPFVVTIDGEPIRADAPDVEPGVCNKAWPPQPTCVVPTVHA